MFFIACFDKESVYKCDWFQFTIHGIDSELCENPQFFKHRILSAVLGTFPCEFQNIIKRDAFVYQKGLNGYKHRLSNDYGIVICFGTPENVGVDMGVNVILSGDFWEIVRECCPDFNLTELYNWWNSLNFSVYDFKIGRIDICIDTSIDFSVFADAYDLGEYVTRFRKSNIRKDVDFFNRGTLYFGSRSSDKMLRIYDKRKEVLENQGYERAEHFLNFVDKECGGSLTRVELVLKHEHAQTALDILNDFDAVGGLFNGSVLFRYVIGYDENRNEIYDTFDWWLFLMGKTVTKTPLVIKDDVPYAWLIDVAMPCLKAVAHEDEKLFLKIFNESSISESMIQKLRNRTDFESNRAYRVRIGNIKNFLLEVFENESISC